MPRPVTQAFRHGSIDEVAQGCSALGTLHAGGAGQRAGACAANIQDPTKPLACIAH